MTGIIHILYKEPNPKTYKGVCAVVRDRESQPASQKVFQTKDPTFDYAYATWWLHAVCACEYVMCSSTVDHFGVDGGKIDYQPDEEYFQKIIKPWFKAQDAKTD